MNHTGSLIPAISLAAGIAVSAVAELSWWWGATLITAALAGYLAIMRMSKDPIATLRLAKWHTAWVAVLFTGIGMLDQNLNRPLTLTGIYGETIPSRLTGEITGIQTKSYGDRLEVRIAGTNGAKIQIRTGATDLVAGDIITFPTDRMQEVANDTSAIVARMAPMLEARGILYTAFIPTKQISSTGHATSLQNYCGAIRDKIEIKIEKSHLQRPTANFLKAILMGDKTGLDEATRLTFAQGGTAHILALSGLHMGILAGMVLWLMWPAKALGKYKWGYALALAILWLYVAITGMSNSSVRACIMISFAYMAIITERKKSIVHFLCCACMLILIFNPQALFDIGFQLSVVCVASLIAFASQLNPISHRNHPILYRICEALLTTIVASAASMPFTSYYFSQLPLMFLPSNLLMLPMIPAFLCGGVFYTLLLYAGWESRLLGHLLDAGYDLMLKATDFLSSGADYVVSYQIPFPALAIYVCLLGATAWIFNRKKVKS